MDDRDGQRGHPDGGQARLADWLNRPTWPTVIVRWRPLRWLDKPLSSVCWVRPRLLSSYVKAAPVAFQGGRVERVQFWLWRLQSPRGSVGGALVLAAAMVTAAVLLGRFGLTPLWGGQDDIEGMAVAMGVTAGYCGALFGFMQAVAVFAVQLRTHQDDSVRPLSPMIARKYLTFILLAAIASVTIANLVLALAAPLLGPSPGVYGAMTWIDIVAVPGVTLAALWYLAAVVSDAGNDDMAMALPVITMAMRDQLARDAEYEQLLIAYVRALNVAGVEYNPLSSTRVLRSGKPTEAIDLPKSGVAIDADCHRLHRLGVELRALAGHPKASVDLLVGQALQEGKTVVLQWDQGEPDPQAPASIHSCARAVFVVSRTGRAMPAGQVRQFLGRFEAVMKKIAREGRHVELDERFANLASLRDAWLGMIRPGTKPPERIRWMRTYDEFAGPLEIDLDDIAMAAAQSDDPSTVVEVANYLMRSAFACKLSGQIQLMAAHLDVAVFLYYRCVHSVPLREAVGKRLDSLLHNLFISIRPDLSAGRRLSEVELRTSHDAALRLALELVYAAIKYDDANRAAEFADRIFEDRETRQASLYDDPAVRPVADDYAGRTDYAAILLVGWSLNVLRNEASKDNKAARAVFDLALAHVPSVPRQLALWELLRGDAPFEAAIDHRLGVSRWDIRDWNREYRTGKSISRWGDDNWPRLGLRASLMATTRSRHGDSRSFFQNPPTRGRWSPAEEEKTLAQVASEPPFTMSEATLTKRLAEIMGVIGQRARDGDVGYLRYVLTEPLSRARVRSHRDDALRSYENNQGWIKAALKSGIGGGEAKLRIEPSSYSRVTPREYLLDDNNWASGFGEMVGEATARQESMALVYKIEHAAPSTDAPETLVDLPGALRDARRALQDKGYHANVLMLPDEHRIKVATFSKSPWLMPGVGEFDGASLGQWEGLLVLCCPYTNTSHALLLDTRKLLTTAHREGEAQPTIEIIEGRDDPELSKAYEGAEKALNSPDEKLPDSHTISVLTRMVAPPPLAIADINAALAIDLRPAAGYVLDAGAKIYHRPGCKLIGDGEHERYLHLPGDKRSQACETCKPNEWDYEAERQRRARIEPTTTDGDAE